MMAAEVFRDLKPFCIDVTKSPSLRSIANLKSALQDVDITTFNDQSLFEYVLFPLKLTIQRIDRENENLLINTVDCISFLFQCSSNNNKDVFIDMFDTCCLLLSSRTHSGGKEMLAEISEELKSSIVALLLAAIDNTDEDVVFSLFSKLLLPRLGHAVSLLLALSEFEKDRDLIINSTKCLKHLALIHKSIPEVKRQHISNVYCSFIPGISISLCRTVRNNSNLGQRVVSFIIDTWREFIVLVMADFRFQVLNDGEVNLNEKLKNLQTGRKDENKLNEKTERKRDLLIQRDKSWMEKTSSKLNLLIETVIPRISNHSSVKVRLAAVFLAKSILIDCTKSMAVCIPRLIEMLAGLQYDEYDEVSTTTMHTIDLARQVLEKTKSSFRAIIEEKLYEKFLSLPRVIRGTNDDQKISVLHIILGYFNLLGNQLATILNSITILEKIMKSFIQALELDIRDVKIVEEKSLMSSEMMIKERNFTGSPYPEIDEHKFMNFKDVKVLHVIRKICDAIGRFADIEVVVDYLLDVFLSSSTHRKEAAIVLIEILRSGIAKDGIGLNNQNEISHHDAKIHSVLIKQIISTFLRDDFWYLPTSNIGDVDGSQNEYLADQLNVMKLESNTNELGFWERGIPVEQLNSNVQLICIMINGLAICSGILKKNFNVFLIKVLYPLLEKHGNENAQIADTAHKALVVISRNCAEVSVAALVSNNADYLVNAISMSFRHLTLFSSAPCVLSVVLSYCNEGMLPLVTDVVNDVFSCLDVYQEEIAFSLMKVLRSLAFSVKTWFAKDFDNDSTKNDQLQYQNENKMSSDELGSFLSSYCRLKLEAVGEVIEDDEISNVGENIEDVGHQNDKKNDSEKKELPKHFQAVLTALEKCQHFLPSKNMALILVVFDVIELCVQSLRHRQDDLLPALHKIWPAIIERLRDSHQVVVSRTLDVLSSMVNCSGDFLRQRIRKDVLPFAIGFLNNQKKTSFKSSPMYKFNHNCKLQQKTITLLGRTIPSLGLVNDDLGKAALAISGYLDCRQPRLLQQAATDALKNIKKADWNYTWLILTTLYSPTELKAPTSQFRDIDIESRAFVRNEYTDNVMEVMYHVTN